MCTYMYWQVQTTNVTYITPSFIIFFLVIKSINTTILKIKNKKKYYCKTSERTYLDSFTVQ